ncbi:MAG: hypothetical protein M5R42_05490 [Rhodocyclaceae bacterium]|nr:hypothetical protein [Rhodocyclaceae bacterium]
MTQAMTQAMADSEADAVAGEMNSGDALPRTRHSAGRLSRAVMSGTQAPHRRDFAERSHDQTRLGYADGGMSSSGRPGVALAMPRRRG